MMSPCLTLVISVLFSSVIGSVGETTFTVAEEAVDCARSLFACTVLIALPKGALSVTNNW